MAKSTVCNFNSLRPALVAAHNSDNRKAVDKDLCTVLDIDNKYLTQWVADVKNLQKTVTEFVDLSWNGKFDSNITEEQIHEAREKIYPCWKELLGCAEKKKDAKQLHVSEFDIDALIKFSWDFLRTGAGTCTAHVAEKKFRQYVESLIGCIIAGNDMLTDSERDLLVKYNKAKAAIDKAEVAVAELDTKIKSFQLLDGQVADAAFKEYIKKQITALEDEKKALQERQGENELIVADCEKDAQELQKRIKYAGK